MLFRNLQIFHFTKEFNLPFTPVHGLEIFDEVNDVENTIRLINVDGFCSTTIQYLTKEQSFLIDVRNVWRRPVDPNVIDDEIEIFKETGWERMDITNVDDFKDLMIKNSKQ